MGTEGQTVCGVLPFVSKIVEEPVTTVLMLAEATLTDTLERTERRAVGILVFRIRARTALNETDRRTYQWRRRTGDERCGAGGAESIVLPEVNTDLHLLACERRAAYQRGKSHAIVVVAEGARYSAEGLTRYFKEHHDCTGFELRGTKLGHIQRGGTPGVFDRLLATRFAAAAVDHLAREKHGVLIGLIKDEITATPLVDVAGKKTPPICAYSNLLKSSPNEITLAPSQELGGAGAK
jgi:hypothetical protein